MLQRCSIIVGNQAVRRSLKPGISFDAESLSSPRSSQASSTGKFAHRFGPRKARTLLSSIGCVSTDWLTSNLASLVKRRGRTSSVEYGHRAVELGGDHASRTNCRL